MDNSTPNMSEKLVQYLDGELAGVEKQNLEQQLAGDPLLRAELESLQTTREAVKLYGLQQKVAGMHPQMMKEMQAPVKNISANRRILRYGIGVAASLILIVGGIMAYNFYNLSSAKIFASNYRSYELSTLRDVDTQQVSPVEKSYREKDYKKVTQLSAAVDTMSIKESFLIALSWSELGNSSEAIRSFKKILEGDYRHRLDNRCAGGFDDVALSMVGETFGSQGHI